MQTLILTSMLIGFAPAPVYKPRPMTLKEQQALLREAEEEMRLAAEQLHKPDRSNAEHAQAAKIYVKRHQSAAEKLGRLHAGLPVGDFRFHVAKRAADAWLISGNAAKAIGFYEEVAERSSVTNARLQSLMEMKRCCMLLRKPEEDAKIMKRVEKEIRGLGGKEKERWMLMLRAQERHLASAGRARELQEAARSQGK